jgi:hypothetical protein
MNQFVPFAHYTAMARPAVAASATFTRIVAGATSRRAAEVSGPAETGQRHHGQPIKPGIEQIAAGTSAAWPGYQALSCDVFSVLLKNKAM